MYNVMRLRIKSLNRYLKLLTYKICIHLYLQRVFLFTFSYYMRNTMVVIRINYLNKMFFFKKNTLRFYNGQKL